MPLYAFGSNGSGQLGIEHTEDVNRPTLTHTPGKEHAVPLMIRAGGNHTVIIFASPSSEAGEVSVCGKVLLGLELETVTHLITLNVQANLCAATWESVLTCHTSPPLLTAWGKSLKGELGRGDTKAAIPFSCASPFEERVWKKSPWAEGQELKIVDVASGLYHNVVVFCDGSVWAWGANRKGQCGKSEASELTRPTCLDNVGFRVKRAVCGREFTYLVGDSQQGQHKILGGLGAGGKRQPGPVFTDAPAGVPGWKDIGANWAGIFVLFQDGRLVSWGRNDHGQMCPPNLPPIKKIAIGSEHALAIDHEDRVIAWGWGEHGNCGSSIDSDGDVKDRYAVIDIPDGSHQIVRGIGAGCATSWIWTGTEEDESLATEMMQMGLVEQNNRPVRPRLNLDIRSALSTTTSTTRASNEVKNPKEPRLWTLAPLPK